MECEVLGVEIERNLIMKVNYVGKDGEIAMSWAVIECLHLSCTDRKDGVVLPLPYNQQAIIEIPYN